MVDEYMPTTEEIREYVEVGGEPRPWIAPEDDVENEAARVAAFDRWLAEHDREVAAKALDEMWAQLAASHTTVTLDGAMIRIKERAAAIRSGRGPVPVKETDDE